MNRSTLALAGSAVALLAARARVEATAIEGHADRIGSAVTSIKGPAG